MIDLILFRNILISVVPTKEEHLQLLSNLENENQVKSVDEREFFFLD